jgi:polyisoprenoid-binding protein YceI
MKYHLLALTLLFPVVSAAADYSSVQSGQSSITFVSRQMSVPVEGVFKKFAAHMRINPARPEAGMAHIEIDLASIDAGSADANEEVKGKSWFSVAEFPKAEFVSSAVKSLGAGKFEAAGKMTIKGKSLEVRAPFTLKEDKGALSIDGAFTLKRLDFGIGSGLWSDTSVVADEVQIKFHLMLK